MPHAVTNLCDAIVYGLKQITMLNGYQNTIQENAIGDPPKTPNDFPTYPAVNLAFLPEDCANTIKGGGTKDGANLLLLENSFEAIFDCFLSTGNNNIRQTQDSILWDLQKYFGVYYYVPDSGGNHTALNCIYTGSMRFGLKFDKPNCGMQVRILFIYRIRSDRPDILK